MRSSPTAACAIELVILARSCTGLKNLLRYARNTVSAPTVIAPARISAAPRQMTIAVHSAMTMLTTGDSSDFTRRALSAASTCARLASSIRPCSRSCRAKAFTTRTDSSPCWTTATMSLCRFRTSWVTLFTDFLNRITNSSRNGVTPMAISAKSHSSQNMSPSIITIVSRSTRMPSVADEAKFWTVATSLVIVDRSGPVCWWS